MGLVPDPLDPALDPDEPVEISQTIYGVEFVPTAAVHSRPRRSAVVNLSDPARTAARGVLDTNRGFEITWDAPDTISASALPYFPADASSAPPTEVARYRLERSWAGRPFAPTLTMEHRSPDATCRRPRTQRRGASTCSRRFLRQTLRRGRTQIWSTRSRRSRPTCSATATTSPIECSRLTRRDVNRHRRTSAPTPLRKFVRPPAPAAPPIVAPLDPAAVPPSGVQVRLLQQCRSRPHGIAAGSRRRRRRRAPAVGLGAGATRPRSIRRRVPRV